VASILLAYAHNKPKRFQMGCQAFLKRKQRDGNLRRSYFQINPVGMQAVIRPAWMLIKDKIGRAIADPASSIRNLGYKLTFKLGNFY